jgi:hypothetical protein
MRSLTILAFLAAFLIVSCTDTSIAPVKSDNQSINFIKLPPKAGLSVENSFTVIKTINGDDGGTIKLKESYIAEDGHTVKIDVKLKIKKNSFSGEKTITMTVDDEIAAVRFTPHMVFNIPMTLDVKFEGIDLSELKQITNGDYEFVYIDDCLEVVEYVDHDGITVDESDGEIRVRKAKLNHFSRYAFAR